MSLALPHDAIDCNRMISFIWQGQMLPLLANGRQHQQQTCRLPGMARRLFYRTALIV